jgi:MFS family permease
MLLITSALISISSAMIIPIYAFFVEELGGTLLDASISGGLFALSAGIGTLVSGKYIDKIKNHFRPIVYGYIIVGLGFLALTQITSITQLYFIQVIIGLGVSIYLPAFDAIYTNHISKTKVAYEWGAKESMFYFALFIGAVVGGFIVNYYGFKTLFLINAGLSLISAALTYRHYKICKIRK